KKHLVEWMKFAVEYVDCDPQGRDPGPAPVRRLNRTEYFKTLRDLLGVETTEAEAVGLPDDAVPDGFDNQAASLTTTTSLVEKYFAAADSMVAALYGDSKSANPAAEAKRKAAYARLMFAQPGGASSERETATRILTKFAGRAFRRPARSEDLAPLLALFDRA